MSTIIYNNSKILEIPQDLEVSSVTASAGFSGAFYGDGSGLTNLPVINTSSFAIKNESNIFTELNKFNNSLENGSGNNAFGDYSHAEGLETNASGNYSHAQGYQSVAYGAYSFAAGQQTYAYGEHSHAEGINTTAGDTSLESYITYGQHSEGYFTSASGDYSHAEGSYTKTIGQASHAEGAGTIANAQNSHAEGIGTITDGNGSHAEGFYTVASGSWQHVQGKYNKPSLTALALIGNGTGVDLAQRSNILEVYQNSINISGSLNVTNTVSASQFIGNFSGSVVSNTLTGSDNRVVYANPAGQLVTINNNYTYDTVNTLVSYKIRINGSAGGLTGSFFTTPSDKGYFVPLNCVYMHESGSLSAGTISAGYTLSTPNDFCNNTSVSLSTLGSFQQISLRTGDNIAKSAPPNTTTKWYLSSGGGTNATGTLCITGFYTGA